MIDTRRRIDVVIGLGIVALGVGIIVTARGIRRSGPAMDPIGPQAFPTIIATVLIVGGIVVAARELISWRRHPDAPFDDGEPDEADVPASAVRAVTLMGLSLVYVLTMSIVGYPIGTVVFVGIALWMMRVRSPLVLVSVSVIYTAASYYVFAQLVLVDLPLGPLLEPFRAMGLA